VPYALLAICTTGDTQSYTTLLAEKGPTRACPEPAGVTLNEELLAFLPRAAWEGCHRTTEAAKRLPGLKEVASYPVSDRVLAARSAWRVTGIEALASPNE
jgi:hypothetical protein